MSKNYKYLVALAIFTQSGCSGEADFASRQVAKSQTAADVKVEEPAIPDQTVSTQTPEVPAANQAPVIKSLPNTSAKPGDPIGKAVAYDLTTWSQSILISNLTDHHLNPQWVVTSAEAIQKINAVPSVLLSDIDSKNQKIEGKWTAGTSGDDDFMGFVYGYQNDRTFYLFDWKKGTQDGYGSPAKKGMSVKLVKADSILTGYDLWPTIGKLNRVTSLFHNDIPWANNVTYTFSLNFVPGSTSIVIKSGETVIADIRVTDNALKSGKFGFYNYSQNDIKYEGFKRTPVQGDDYVYQVEAEDADGDKIKYSLAANPIGMVINADTGLVSWPKANIVAGLHKISIVVTDEKGMAATQEYEINVVI